MVKFLTHANLRFLNEWAIKEDFGRSLYFENLPIAPNDIYPVVMHFLHNDSEVRCKLVLNKHGDTAWLDIPIGKFTELPEASVEPLPEV